MNARAVERVSPVVLDLSKENDPEVLRKAALLLEQENRRLTQKIVELTRKLGEARGADQQQLLLELEELQRQLAVRNKKLFGRSSEKRNKRNDGDADADQPSPQTGHGPRQQELREVDKTHELDEADKICTVCGGELEEWPGQDEESEEITSISREFVIVRHKRKKYRCKCGSCIETAPGPLKLIPGGRYSIDFAIEVCVDKYLDHMPLARQVRKMRREGLITDTQTLWNQLERVAAVINPVYQRLQSHLLTASWVGVDETTWRLMGKANPSKKKWQVWTLAASDGVYYRLQDSRGTSAAAKMLDGYRGVVMCDGYKAYSDLAKQRGSPLVLVHCWAHVRRKFVEIADFFPEETDRILGLIGELYQVERTCPSGSAGDELRAQLRNERSRAIIADIKEWAATVQARPESGLDKAIAYMTGIWSGLVRFLDNPSIPLDNNATERANRGPVVGRKNHYGSRSKRGTEVAAVLYSLLESAKICGLDPREYLRTAIIAGLEGREIPLPHELRKELAGS